MRLTILAALLFAHDQCTIYSILLPEPTMVRLEDYSIQIFFSILYDLLLFCKYWAMSTVYTKKDVLSLLYFCVFPGCTFVFRFFINQCFIIRFVNSCLEVFTNNSWWQSKCCLKPVQKSDEIWWWLNAFIVIFALDWLILVLKITKRVERIWLFHNSKGI